MISMFYTLTALQAEIYDGSVSIVEESKTSMLSRSSQLEQS